MAGKHKILCVEDEALLLEDLQEELEDAGYEVRTACNGVEAVRQIKLDRPDLILCDMMMPELDGPTLFKAIRRELPSMDAVPFVFLTAKATREDIIAGKKMGVDDYLTKPIDYDLLLATVETRLGQVSRIEERNRNRLQAIHAQILKLKSARGAIKVSMVTDMRQLVAPINSALLELGCEVRTVSEGALNESTFDPKEDNIVFFVCSSNVQRYLNDLKAQGTRKSETRFVLLAAPNMSDGAREGFLKSGIDDIIEYPYKPVEIFKQVVDHLRDPEAAAGSQLAS